MSGSREAKLLTELAETQDQRSSLLATNYDLRKERDRLTDELAEARGLLQRIDECDAITIERDWPNAIVEEADAIYDDMHAFLMATHPTHADQPKDVVCNCDDHDARYCVNRASRTSPCVCRCHGASDTAAHSGEATTTGTQPTSLTNTDKPAAQPQDASQ